MKTADSQESKTAATFISVVRKQHHSVRTTVLVQRSVLGIPA